MTLDDGQIQSIGADLYSALRSCQPITPLVSQYPGITIQDAYQISREMLRLRMTGDNERITGKKIGVTSAAVQEMLGVFQPDFGFLTDAMTIGNGGDIAIDGQLIAPRAEGEIAFKLKRTLSGTAITEVDVLAATDYITPCFEIVDSRIADWKIAIQDTIADNASCGVYVLGDAKLDPRATDLAAVKVELFMNGQPLSVGTGSAVQGNPLTAVAWLANTLGAFGTALEAGEIILSGSVVPLQPVAAGDKLELRMTGDGISDSHVSCRFV